MKIRVWRQLCRDSRAQSITDMMAALENDLRQKLILVRMHRFTYHITYLFALFLLFCEPSTLVLLYVLLFFFTGPFPSPFFCLTFPSHSYILPCFVHDSVLRTFNVPVPSLLFSFLQLPSPLKTDAEATNVFQRSDSTVVLFYDHLTHSTPDEHVESIAR